ncbi:MAG: FlgD immunoglobulin-like domain containing protein, partial [Calditrichaceae bacterium]
ESVSVNGLAIEEKVVEVSVPVPDDYALFNNYPNPFNPTTNIKFQLPESQQIRLAIYDVNGSLVKTLSNNRVYPGGEHIVSWDATDNAGNRVATGIYLYQFQAGSFVKTGKMILVK